jgi:hypothetical protein
MIETDLQRAVDLVADLSGNGRVRVSGPSYAFMLHDPAVHAVECGDFEVSGQWRRRIGDSRTW